MGGRRVIIVMGPTGVGKSDYAISLALKYGSPVISCDSRQIYREMRIGTAVPSLEDLARVAHHFIQTHSIHERFSAGDYEVQARALCRRLFAQGHDTLVMAGGSGFFVDAFVNGLGDFPEPDPELRAMLTSRLASEGPQSLAHELAILDPEAFATIDRSNGQRLLRALEVCLQTGRTFSSFRTTGSEAEWTIEKIALTRPREQLYARTDARVDAMMASGLEEEARGLYQWRHLPALQTVGYRELFDYFEHEEAMDLLPTEKRIPYGMDDPKNESGIYGLGRATDLIKRNTRRYIRKQLSWLRRYPDLKWVEL